MRVLEVDRDTARPRPSNRGWSSSRDCRRVRFSTKCPSAAAVAAAGRRLSLPSDRRLRNSRSHRNSNRSARSKAGGTATSCARKAASPPVKKMSMASSSQPLPARYKTVRARDRGRKKSSGAAGQLEKEISESFSSPLSWLFVYFPLLVLLLLVHVILFMILDMFWVLLLGAIPRKLILERPLLVSFYLILFDFIFRVFYLISWLRKCPSLGYLSSPLFSRTNENRWDKV